MDLQRGYIKELDGLRALAIGLVLVTHLLGDGGFVPRPLLYSLPAPVSLIITHGWLGVDLFFVLSGFLITGILLNAKGKKGYFRGFYTRRLLRIAPLYFAVLIVLIGAYGYEAYSTYWNFALALSANVASLLDARVPAAAGPMWSLAVEEQFYLFWPLVVILMSRARLAFVAIAIIVVEPLVRYWIGTGTDQLLYPWFRFDGLALGALLAVWFSAANNTIQKNLWLGAVLAALSLTIIAATAPFGGLELGRLSTAVRISEAILSFGALLVIAISLRGSRYTAVLRCRPARIVADLSFCLYLVHVPLVQLFEILTHRFFSNVASLDPALLVPIRALVVLSIAFTVAALSRRYLELPFLRLKSVLDPPPTGTEATIISRDGQDLERGDETAANTFTNLAEMRN